MATRKKPVLFPYMGSKWRMVNRIVELMPDHTHFVDLFGGSGAMTLGKPYSQIESFNDKDLDIYNLYRCILDGRFYDLKERVANTPSRSQRFFADALEVLSQPIKKFPDVKAAWAFLLVAHQGVLMHPRLKRPSNWLPLIKEWRDRWGGLPKTLDLVRMRFKNVQLFHDDWSKIVHRLDRPRTLFYIDPPYPKAVLTAHRKLYVHDMPGLEEHRAMLTRLLSIKGYVILSGYPHVSYDEVLAHWRRIDVRTRTNIGMTEKASPRTECLWFNFSTDGKRL